MVGFMHGFLLTDIFNSDLIINLLLFVNLFRLVNSLDFSSHVLFLLLTGGFICKVKYFNI